MKTCVLALLGISGILAWGMPAAADTEAELEEARKAIEEKDYAKAMAIVQPLAEEGNAVAQYNLAAIYRQGAGTLKNPELAMEWFKKAAAQGGGNASWAVGVMYALGEGTEKDIVEAYIWFRQGAAQGSSQARKALIRAARGMTDEQVQEARQRADDRAKKSPAEPAASESSAQ